MFVEPVSDWAEHDVVPGVHAVGAPGCVPEFPEGGGVFDGVFGHVAPAGVGSLCCQVEGEVGFAVLWESEHEEFGSDDACGEVGVVRVLDVECEVVEDLCAAGDAEVEGKGLAGLETGGIGTVIL